jgi:hypothetical protein
LDLRYFFHPKGPGARYTINATLIDIRRQNDEYKTEKIHKLCTNRPSDDGGISLNFLTIEGNVINSRL